MDNELQIIILLHTKDHQVCMDYYQVACHEGTGTNPLATNYELLKLSSINQNSGLDSEKISFVNPDVADRNTLGDDFQVDEYNNNRLATSQNTFFQSSKPNRKPSSDIFYKNFDYTTKYTTRRTTTATTTTTPRRPSSSTTTSTTTTAAPLLFRSPIPSNAPNSASTKRKPNLETYESYEIGEYMYLHVFTCIKTIMSVTFIFHRICGWTNSAKLFQSVGVCKWAESKTLRLFI